jgi:uroporphyrin-III C-methyltransferase/precorrin-2 dehydrogenase/sirohydrochlorin ferrochelatase
VTLVTGHGSDPDDDRDWETLAGGRQTLVVYMGVSRAGELMQNLTTNGRAADTPVAIVERGTLPGQRIVRGTLGQLELLVSAHRITSPALLIIGAVARRGAAMTPGVPSMTGESAITGAACAIIGASL